jgi:hypothetical protein
MNHSAELENLNIPSDGTPVVVEIMSDKKPSDTQRSGELRVYFMPVVPDELTLKILGLKQ